jgi:ABC-type dipeptide/oligopeptide/nickel transport system permease subunit
LATLNAQSYSYPSRWSEFIFSLLQNKGAVVGAIVILATLTVGLFAEVFAPHNPAQVFESQVHIPPIWAEGGQTQFLLGTDDLGRDLLSRLVFGARVSMLIGFLVVVFSTLIGTALGVWAGYRGGWVDSLIMRGIDIFMSLPSILLSIVVVVILGPGLVNAIWAVSVVAIPGFVRVVRAAVIEEKSKQYVVVAQSLGASGLRISILEILPNCLAPILVQATLGFSDGILNAAALGFLGLGAQPPTAEWGTMLSDARSYISSAPWQMTLPGFCILVVVLGFNIFGDGLRDALDPRLKK